MKQEIFKIKSNEKIAKDVYEMLLEGDTSAITAPGQFVNVLLQGKYLRRPISVCDYSENSLTLVYKAVGSGTEQMSNLRKGEMLNILIGLGNGYDLSIKCEKPVLIGGGVGVPPMYNLCKRLIESGKTVSVILGFNSAEEVFYEKEFVKIGAKVTVTTVDGSCGIKGFVTDALKDTDYDYFFTCGPMPMFQAVESVAKSSGQFSFEERMGCGFGACMGCSCKTKYGNKRICKDGPVLKREEIIW